MLRAELIIKKTDLASQGGASDAGQMRLFTDATGKFKIRAKIVKQDASSVTLLTEKGKEVTLPLSKLSEKDQQFLQQYATAENPFE